MKIINDDWFNGDWHVGIHVANLYHTFGSGIAYSIKNKYPEVYAEDKKTGNGDESKLGNFSKKQISENKIIYNLYAMEGIGNNGNPLDRNLKYDNFYDGFYKICEESKKLGKNIVGVPYLIGCCRAGGSWNIVLEIMVDICNIFSLDLQIYKLDNFESSAHSSVVI